MFLSSKEKETPILGELPSTFYTKQQPSVPSEGTFVFVSSCSVEIDKLRYRYEMSYSEQYIMNMVFAQTRQSANVLLAPHA